MMYDATTLGVLELTSFNKFEAYKIDFLKKLTENITSVIYSMQANIKIEEMLVKSKLQAEELVSREEELRQNMEEMKATQEEATRRERDLISKSEEYNKKEKILLDELEKQKSELKKNRKKE